MPLIIFIWAAHILMGKMDYSKVNLHAGRVTQASSSLIGLFTKGEGHVGMIKNIREKGFYARYTLIESTRSHYNGLPSWQSVFSELHQLDTFYNALNANDQDSLNSAAGGNFLDKMPRECLRIIESKSKVRNSRNKAVVAKVSSNSSTPGISPDVAALTTDVSDT
ncbi:hypothetical protein Tco_0438241 [Tanacetum coccineum]